MGESIQVSVERRAIGELPVIRLSGEVERVNVDLLEELVTGELVAGQPSFIFDMESCTFIDSSVLTIFLNLRMSLDGRGLIAFAAPNVHIQRILEITGLLDAPGFRVFASVAEALQHASMEE